jgi:metal-responsive CopG/Arc/MetJ family transcriptional regulator
MVKNEDVRYWNVPVPKSLDEALEAAIKEKGYRTKTEFIRGVVRREIEQLGIKPVSEHESS